jgi:hypothetical protein
VRVAQVEDAGDVRAVQQHAPGDPRVLEPQVTVDAGAGGDQAGEPAAGQMYAAQPGPVQVRDLREIAAGEGERGDDLRVPEVERPVDPGSGDARRRDVPGLARAGAEQQRGDHLGADGAFRPPVLCLVQVIGRGIPR